MTQVVEAKREENIISGIWKFRERIPVEVLHEVAHQILAEEPEAYRSMQIRKTSRNQLGICFVYDCGASAHDQSVYDRFFERMTDRLKRQFGNDLIGWDVTNDVWTVK